jgi:hypothetical protein
VATNGVPKYVDGNGWAEYYVFHTLTIEGTWNHGRDPFAPSQDPYSCDLECPHGWLAVDGDKVGCSCFDAEVVELPEQLELRKAA